MRRWLLILVILLLPLRGWMGEAMAGQMHHAPLGTHAHPAATVQTAQPPAAHGCEAHAHAAPAQDAQAQPQADADVPTCASCQVCSAVALSPAAAASPASTFSQPRPQTVQPAYASADTGLFFKPPRH
ncbi:MAG TPA: hypothetical protein VGD76_00125 [Ramlibacter sp.]